MPNGTDTGRGDRAPAQSPVLALSGSQLATGMVLTFSATGLVAHSPTLPLAGPDGIPNTAYGHDQGAQFGKSSILAPGNALIGVFLSDARPDTLPAAPASLQFNSNSSLSFAQLAPALRQTFFIGDGVNQATGLAQRFIVPDGATRLFLGTMDRYGWNDNRGSFSVTVVPAPAAAALLGLAGLARRTRR